MDTESTWMQEAYIYDLKCRITETDEQIAKKKAEIKTVQALDLSIKSTVISLLEKDIEWLKAEKTGYEKRLKLAERSNYDKQ